MNDYIENEENEYQDYSQHTDRESRDQDPPGCWFCGRDHWSKDCDSEDPYPDRKGLRGPYHQADAYGLTISEECRAESEDSDWIANAAVLILPTLTKDFSRADGEKGNGLDWARLAVGVAARIRWLSRHMELEDFSDDALEGKTESETTTKGSATDEPQV